MYLNEVLEDLKKETDEKYVKNIISNLEKEYEKSPLRINDEQWMYVGDLSTKYRIENRIPLSK